MKNSKSHVSQRGWNPKERNQGKIQTQMPIRIIHKGNQRIIVTSLPRSLSFTLSLSLSLSLSLFFLSHQLNNMMDQLQRFSTSITTYRPTLTIILNIQTIIGLLKMVYDNNRAHKTAKHKTAKHKTAKHKTAKHKTAKHKTAKHKTAKHKTAKHKTAKG